MRPKNRLILCIIVTMGFGFLLQAAMINGTAAKVGKTIITIEDARFFHGLQAFKEGRSNPLEEPGLSQLKKTVQKLIFEEMVYAESKNFKGEKVPLSTAEKLIRSQKVNGKEKTWRSLLSRFSKTESAAVSRVVMSLTVEKFVQKKVETLTPIITEAEVERYYRQNKSRFRGSDLNSIKTSIVLLLKKERVEKGLEEWIQFLKKKYQVTNFLEI